MSQALASAVYEGRVRHRRHVPRAHAFTYRMAQLYLDLDEIDDVFRGRWLWSAGRRNLAEFRRSDFIEPAELSLADAVRQRVKQACGDAVEGPIRLLAHLRYGGHVFNPVSFYYCHAADWQRLTHVVAEITNTPWKERHAYILPVAEAEHRGRALHWDFAKRFHVSPFMAMTRDYHCSFTPPADDLHVHMKVLDAARVEFDADLQLQRRTLDGDALARVLMRYPLMTMRVVGAIHWQALKLWLKRVPVHDHPQHAVTRQEDNA